MQRTRLGAHRGMNDHEARFGGPRECVESLVLSTGALCENDDRKPTHQKRA